MVLPIPPPASSSIPRVATLYSKVLQQPSPQLYATLESLGLWQYVEGLVAYGFDTWESILDIHEDDFESLQFKLGHRRKLQRRIADWLSEHDCNLPLSPQISRDSRKRKREGCTRRSTPKHISYFNGISHDEVVKLHQAKQATMEFVEGLPIQAK
jgi:hypothetical protein